MSDYKGGEVVTLTNTTGKFTFKRKSTDALYTFVYGMLKITQKRKHLKNNITLWATILNLGKFKSMSTI